MPTFRQRGDRWYAEVFVRGKRKGKTFSSRTAARRWAEAQEDELRSGVMPAGSLAEVMRRYSGEVSPTKRGVRWEQLRLDLFARTLSFAGKPIGDVTPDDIGQWRDARLLVVAPGSVLRELNLLSSVFEQARREWRMIRVNPVRDVRRPPAPPARDARVSDEQAELIFAVARYARGQKCETAQQLAAAAFDLALQTAMRAGEILSLRRETIHLAPRYVTLPKTKNGSARDVPLSTAAVEILKGLDPDRPFPISSAVLDQSFRRIRDRAGFKDALTFHDSRAEATTRLAKKLDIHDLARMTGHKNLKSLLVYYRATASEIAGRLD